MVQAADSTSDSKNDLLREAIRLSLHAVASGEGGPFGAVVAQGGRIVGRGWNRVTSARDPTAHAEIEAIRDACRSLGSFSLAGCEMFCSCEPCPMCLAAIHWARIDRIVYALTAADAAAIGFDDEWIHHQLAAPHHARQIPMERCLHGEARAAFDAWTAKPDRVPY